MGRDLSFSTSIDIPAATANGHGHISGLTPWNILHFDHEINLVFCDVSCVIHTIGPIYVGMTYMSQNLQDAPCSRNVQP